jgi:hypothetical protein
MNFEALRTTAILPLLGLSLYGGDKPPAVIVCINPGGDLETVERAQTTAARIFASVGVRIEWRKPASCPDGPDQPIIADLTSHTPKDYLPGAFGFALPFEGVHIGVFYDRLSTIQVYRRPNVLAHVLAHEIAHILEGTDQHTETGVMKRRWDTRDYARMQSWPLGFTEADVILINLGMKARRTGLAAANSPIAKSPQAAVVAP